MQEVVGAVHLFQQPVMHSSRQRTKPCQGYSQPVSGTIKKQANNRKGEGLGRRKAVIRRHCSLRRGTTKTKTNAFAYYLCSL